MHICMRPRPYWSFENNGLSLYLSWFLVAKSWQRIAWWKANYFVYLNLVAVHAGWLFNLYSLFIETSHYFIVPEGIHYFIMAPGYLIETNLSSCINCRGVWNELSSSMTLHVKLSNIHSNAMYGMPTWSMILGCGDYAWIKHVELKCR